MAATEQDLTMAVRPGPIFHGGDLDAVRARFPDAPEPWVDLSTGINPVSYPIPPLTAWSWARLPQSADEALLLDTAAQRYGAGRASMVIAAPGTQALIQILPRLRATSRVAVVGPTYAEHAAAWRAAGHDVHEVTTLEDARTADVVVVVNPNNPTGRLVPLADLHAVADALKVRGGLLVVDEAFMDVLPEGASLVPDLPPATVVLRSFGKTYGLAGLRLGFAVAQDELGRPLSGMLGPWAVAGPALAIGTAALGDDVWLRETKERLSRDAARLDALLVGAGCEVLGGTPLFRLAKAEDANKLADRLGCHGIYVRRFPEQPSWVRFGLPGDSDAWKRLTQALK